jgi:hypothetical protein
VKNCIHLWQFLRDLLQNEKYNPSHVCWIDAKKGIFKVVEPNKVSQLWAFKKGRKTMSYENLSRGLRYLNSLAVILFLYIFFLDIHDKMVIFVSLVL